MIQSTPFAFLMALVAAVGFGFLGFFGKLGQDRGFHSAELLTLRFFVSTVILALVLACTPKLRLPLKQALAPVCLGFFGYALVSLLFFETVKLQGAGKASVLLYTYPTFVTLIEIFVSSYRPDTKRIVALVMGLLGCALTVYSPSGAFSLPGVLTGIATAASYALYFTLSSKYLRAINPVFSCLFVSLGATLSLGLVTAFGKGLSLPDGYEAWSLVLALALICTVIPIMALFQSLKRLSASTVAVISTFEPVVAVTVAYVLLGEVLGTVQILGAGIVVVSIIILALASRQKQEGEPPLTE
jgi:drug/metabolite transporter (DMT)-like permease